MTTDTVIFIGPLPPPMNGAAMTSQGFVDALKAYGPITTYDVSPDKKNRGGLANIIKPLRVGRALVGMLLSIWRRNKAVYFALDGGYGLIYSVAIAAVARFCRYRLFMHHHSFAYINFPSGLMGTLAHVAGPTATHIMLCPVMADRIRAVYPQMKRLQVVSSAAFVPQFDLTDKPKTPELRVGLISNLEAEKGLDTVLDLLREALRVGLKMQLVLAGRAHNHEAKLMIDAAKVEFGDYLEHLGSISDEAKHTYFQNLDVFVFPTRYINEAQPRVILEALSYGVPVITRARSCIPGDVGEAGICIDEEMDFVGTAIPVLQRWSNDPSSLAEISRYALERSHKLHEEGRRQLDELVRNITGFSGV